MVAKNDQSTNDEMEQEITTMITLSVYDPAMCCSTGVCGPDVDPVLLRFSADLQWLATQGVTVERFNLAQQPEAFAASDSVKEALTEEGNQCLPLVLVHGEIVSRGTYPTREQLMEFTGLEEAARDLSIFSDEVAELVAIGAAIASNCEPCFKFHFDKARKLGVSRQDMMLAVRTAQAVKETPARSIIALAERYLAEKQDGLPVIQNCCG
jgi:AhpD family alkylhydroperoxidase